MNWSKPSLIQNQIYVVPGKTRMAMKMQTSVLGRVMHLNSFLDGTTSTDSEGATFNIELGSKKYLIQRNWSPVVQGCLNSV